MIEPWCLFHTTLWICKLRICSYGQILTVNLLVKCKNSVIYGHFVVIRKKKVLWKRPLVSSLTGLNCFKQENMLSFVRTKAAES